MILMVLAIAMGAQPQAIVWGASYCAPCRAVEAAADELAAEGWPVSQHDVQEEQAAAQAWAVASVPTVQIIKDGVELERVVGRIDRDALVVLMTKHGIKPPPSERRTIAWDTGKYL